MTICIATDGFPPQIGGVTTFNKHLVSVLLEAGHTVVILYLDYNTDTEDKIITEGALTRVILSRSYQTYYKSWRPYFRPGGFDAPNWIAIGMAMRDWILANHQQYKIDLIEVSDYGGAAIFLCDAQLPPLVITGHGSLLQYSRYNFTVKDDSYKVVRKLEELSFIHGDTVISHSPLNKKDLEQLFNREIAFARIPWEHRPLLTGGDQSNVTDKLVVVGGMQPIKGIYDMIAAMEILKLKAPALTLYWIGGDTWLAPGQQKMSPYLQQKYPAVWQQNFKWKDAQSFDDTQRDILSASLVIIPATFETFNYVALEAALYQKPIIITDKAGAVAYFTHSVDAWIVPANNPEALAEAIIYLSNQPSLCHQLGVNAYETIKKIFDPKLIAADRLAIYQFTIQNRKNASGGLHAALSFLNKYRTPVRKYYYCVRRLLKKLIGRA